MVNYACAFSQSESGKYFEWITVLINYLGAEIRGDKEEEGDERGGGVDRGEEINEEEEMRKETKIAEKLN